MRNKRVPNAGSFKKGLTPHNKGKKILLFKTCEYCGDKFEARNKSKRVPNQRFCSRLCAARNRRGNKHWKWKGDGITHKSLHKRVYNVRGKASLHECVDCGKQAKDWSHIGIGKDVFKNFQPRCRKCHLGFDDVANKAWKTKKEKIC